MLERCKSEIAARRSIVESRLSAIDNVNMHPESGRVTSPIPPHTQVLRQSNGVRLNHEVERGLLGRSR
jgi:hypothetical protein